MQGLRIYVYNIGTCTTVVVVVGTCMYAFVRHAMEDERGSTLALRYTGGYGRTSTVHSKAKKNRSRSSLSDLLQFCMHASTQSKLQQDERTLHVAQRPPPSASLAARATVARRSGGTVASRLHTLPLLVHTIASSAPH